MQRGTLNSGKTGLTGTASYSQSWTPDALGNFTTVTTNGTAANNTVNQQNEYTTTGVTYDADGNSTADGTGDTFVYDAWNRLVDVKSGGSTIAAYGYDGLGRRLVQTDGSTTTDLYYSDQWQVLEERIGGVVQARNVWSPVFQDALVLRDQSSLHNGTLDQRLYVEQDADWNVTSLVISTGSVVERYVYNAYGKVSYLTATWGALSGSAYGAQYLYQGQRLDATSSIYDSRNRAYDPALSRFLQTDPTGLKPDVNDYRFVGNRPIEAVDPQGEWLTLITAVAGAVIGAGVGYYYTGTAKGAIVGGVSGGAAGLTLGLAGPAIATSVGGGWVGGVAAGGVSGAYGDMCGQCANIVMGEQGDYDPGEIAVAGTVGGIGGGFLRPGNAVYQPICHWGGPIRPGCWVQVGTPGVWTWVNSGMIERYPLYPVATGVVPGPTLVYPPGWEAIKGLQGQRIYLP